MVVVRAEARLAVGDLVLRAGEYTMVELTEGVQKQIDRGVLTLIEQLSMDLDLPDDPPEPPPPGPVDVGVG